MQSLQSLLAALADLDCAFDRDVETVTASAVPDTIKQAVVSSLRRRHEERRAPYARRLEVLQRQLTRPAAALG